MLWFDVGIDRYTTPRQTGEDHRGLWFDVGIDRYTTFKYFYFHFSELWFDVGIDIHFYIGSIEPLYRLFYNVMLK